MVRIKKSSELDGKLFSIFVCVLELLYDGFPIIFGYEIILKTNIKGLQMGQVLKSREYQLGRGTIYLAFLELEMEYT